MRMPVIGISAAVSMPMRFTPHWLNACANEVLDVDCAVQGTRLEIRNQSGAIGGTAEPLPFDDPKKTKRTAKG